MPSSRAQGSVCGSSPDSVWASSCRISQERQTRATQVRASSPPQVVACVNRKRSHKAGTLDTRSVDGELERGCRQRLPNFKVYFRPSPPALVHQVHAAGAAIDRPRLNGLTRVCLKSTRYTRLAVLALIQSQTTLVLPQARHAAHLPHRVALRANFRRCVNTPCLNKVKARKQRVLALA